MDRAKIVLFAYSEVGCLCLEELIKKGANVAAVFTHNDDPGEEIWFRSVRAIAGKKGIPVHTPQKLGAQETDYLRSLKPELILSCYYRALIPKAVLDMPRLGAYNIHGALLPKYRGRACVNWAVLNGEKETGATLHVMTERADRGDIVDQERVPIEFTDTAYDVFMKVAEAARLILARVCLSLRRERRRAVRRTRPRRPTLDAAVPKTVKSTGTKAPWRFIILYVR